MKYYQQGDVLLKEYRGKITNNLLETDLIHKGMNHHHKIKGEFQIVGSQEEMVVICKSPCELYHEEHNTIVIPEGTYKKDIVLEYDHWLEESREVID